MGNVTGETHVLQPFRDLGKSYIFSVNNFSAVVDTAPNFLRRGGSIATVRGRLACELRIILDGSELNLVLGCIRHLLQNCY